MLMMRAVLEICAVYLNIIILRFLSFCMVGFSEL